MSKVTQADFEGLSDEESIALQLAQWVEGNPVHNPVREECCPDFSCCSPEFLAERKVREAFAKADESGRMNMLGMFLGNALASLGHDKVYVSDGVETEEH